MVVPIGAAPFGDGASLSGLAGKIALVSGAGRRRSIGHSVAQSLARAGADVVVVGTGRDPDTFPDDEKAISWRDIDSVADEIRAIGRRSLPLVVDVTDFDSVKAARVAIEEQFGRLDILVNSAAASRGGDRVPLLDMPPLEWRRVIEVNLIGVFNVCYALAPLMVDRPGASIVNISSIASKHLGPNVSAYAASKIGVNALTATLAHELGPRGVRVNALCPGFIETSRTDDIGRGERYQALVDRLPIKRAGSPEDIANMTLYLCSDQGSWVTGQSWNIDGGQVVQH